MSNLKLTIDLLPKGAWGNNLSSILPKKDWDTLRNFAYEKARHKCAICGYDGDLDAHEVWDFDVKTKTQTLKDIIALCSACHGVKHFRNSTRIGYGEQAKAHFFKINKCSPLVFASHYAEAQFLFEERNKVLRWKLNVNLDRFGGKGIEVIERNIPFIESPYSEVDWETVNHVKIDGGKVPSNIFSEAEGAKKITLLLTHEEAINEMIGGNRPSAYFSIEKAGDIVSTECPLPPRIESVDVDNYQGTITIVSAYTNRIEWLKGDEIIKTKYNFGGKFTTKFSVEDMDGTDLSFRLIGSFGQACSQIFEVFNIA
jgi:hypothetical protein